MSKRNKPTNTGTPDVSQGEVGLQLIIDKPLYDLLKEGRINQVLTWKEVKEKPERVSVTSTEDDEAIILKVKHVDTVGFGYVPKGYPAQYAANQKTTRIHVEKDEQPADSTPENNGGDSEENADQ